MTDRELLELAAKAVGIDPDFEGPNTPRVWNPLTDDGDAFRLAVKLGFGIVYETQESMGGRFIEVSYDIDDDEETCRVVMKLLGDDPCAAARRAIVEAAAETQRLREQS